MNGNVAENRLDDARAPEPLPLGPWLQTLPLPWITEIEVDAILLRSFRLRSPACAVVRGLLGEQLRWRHCRTGASTCDGCRVWRECDYAAAFGTGNGPRPAAGGLADLHPFWLQGIPAAHELAPGTRFTARLVTAGLPDTMVQSLHLTFRGAVGLLGETGKRRGESAPLVSASRASRRRIQVEPCAADTWWIEARTPLLLAPARHEEHLPPCPQAPWLPALLGAGSRRLKALARAFGPAAGESTVGDLSEPPFPPVAIPSLRDVEIVSGSLRPWRGAVVSRRQGRAFPLEHGLTGGVLLRGSTMPAVGALLRALEVTGVGKKTTMGFGHLAVQAVR